MPHITAEKLKTMQDEIKSLREEVADLRAQLEKRQRRVKPSDNQTETKSEK